MKLSPYLIPLLAVLASAQAPALGQSGDVLYRIYGRPFAELSKARVVGDVDGDLAEDFLVGSPFAPKTGNVGYCALISGIDGTVIREHFGLTSTEFFGADFGKLHDLNSDGINEYAVSVPGRKSGSSTGVVMIYDGATGAELRALRDLSVTSRFGDGLVGGTDLTGDGIPDLAVLAIKSGAIKIFDGDALLTVFLPSKVIRTNNPMAPSPSNYSQRPLVALDDLDGDGIAEICYSNRESNGSSTPNSMIFSTGTGLSVFDDWKAGYAINFDDINGDGVDEFVFGYDGNGEFFAAGTAYIFNGATRTVIYDVYGDTLGFRNWSMGWANAMIDDVTGDGIRDLICGAPGNGDPSAVGSGLWLVDGSNGNILEEVQHDGFLVGNGFGNNPYMGYDLETGDIDGDGELELLVGAPKVHHTYGGFIDLRAGLILACEIDY